MPAATTRLLMALAVLGLAVAIYVALDDGPPNSPSDLEDAEDVPRRSPPRQTEEPERGPKREAPPTKQGPHDGVPRVLPPDAALEDVRDALATQGASRSREIQQAFASIAEIADDGADVRRGLRRYLPRLEDPVARGIAIAAIGASRDAANIQWLIERLRNAPTDEERLGALIGLAQHDATSTARAEPLADIEYGIGALPTSRPALEALAGWLVHAKGAFATSSVPVLRAGVRASADIAALLATGGKMCALYLSLEIVDRRTLREAALAHDALPGAARRVIEAAN